MSKFRKTIDLSEINEEGVRLIAKLGAQSPTILRRVVEDLLKDRVSKRHSVYWLVQFIVHSHRITPVLTEEALIHYGLWAGAKRY